MGICDKIFGRKTFDSRLHGVWISDLNDDATNKNIGSVTMTFTADGKLIYDAHDSEKTQRINMVYWTKDDTVFTNQPSSPKLEKTKYSFPINNVLTLEFGGQLTRFLKHNA